MNKRAKLSLLIGIVVILASIAIFSISSPAIFTSTIVGLIFLLASETIFFGGIALTEYFADRSSGILTRAGVGLTIEGYAIVVFISSLVYMNMQTLFYRGFIILQIVLFVIAFAIAAVLALFSKSAQAKDARVLTANAMCKDFETELLLIQEKVSDKESINKLIEGIRYSDTSSICDADVEIDEKIQQLKDIAESDEFDEEAFSKTVKDIDFLIKKRKLQIKNMKQGGI